MEFIWSINGVVTMTMTRMMTMMVMQLKRCWVPEGICFWLQRKWESICHGEELAPMENEPVVAGKFPLHLLIIILPGTMLPREAVLPGPVIAPDSLALPCSEPGAGRLSPLLRKPSGQPPTG